MNLIHSKPHHFSGEIQWNWQYMGTRTDRPVAVWLALQIIKQMGSVYDVFHAREGTE
jgi:hypothetical protein